MRAVEFKQALRSGQTVLGIQQFLPSAAITEMAGLAGFDWAWLCIEHGAAAVGTDLENLIRTCDGVGMTSIIRVINNEYSIVQRCMDLGADGVMIPRVRTRADVELAVEFVKFPPMGKRGICGVTRAWDYGERSPAPEALNDETIVMLLIETPDAVDNLDDMLTVPGLDCVIFGQGDLSLELGIRDAVVRGDPQAKEVVAGYRRRFLDACRRHGVPMGQPIADLKQLPGFVEEGMTVLASRTDIGMIMGSFKELVQSTQKETERAGATAAV